MSCIVWHRYIELKLAYSFVRLLCFQQVWEMGFFLSFSTVSLLSFTSPSFASTFYFSPTLDSNQRNIAHYTLETKTEFILKICCWNRYFPSQTYIILRAKVCFISFLKETNHVEQVWLAPYFLFCKYFDFALFYFSLRYVNSENKPSGQTSGADSNRTKTVCPTPEGKMYRYT